MSTITTVATQLVSSNESSSTLTLSVPSHNPTGYGALSALNSDESASVEPSGTTPSTDLPISSSIAVLSSEHSSSSFPHATFPEPALNQVPATTLDSNIAPIGGTHPPPGTPSSTGFTDRRANARVALFKRQSSRLAAKREIAALRRQAAFAIAAKTEAAMRNRRSSTPILSPSRSPSAHPEHSIPVAVPVAVTTVDSSGTSPFVPPTVPLSPVVPVTADANPISLPNLDSGDSRHVPSHESNYIKAQQILMGLGIQIPGFNVTCSHCDSLPCICPPICDVCYSSPCRCNAPADDPSPRDTCIDCHQLPCICRAYCSDCCRWPCICRPRYTVNTIFNCHSFSKCCCCQAS